MGGFSGSGSLGTLWVEIQAKVDDALKGIQQFGQDVGKELDNQKEKWAGLKSVGESMTTVGAGLTAALTLPIAGIGAAAVSAASEFEGSMNKITAVSGTTGAELEALRQLALKLGADTKFSAQEAAEGMGNLAAAGLTTQQIMDAMSGVLALAAAGQLSVAQASKTATETMGQFGLAASDVSMIADVLAKGANASSVEVSELIGSLTLVGPVARLAGQDLQETVAQLSLLSKEGIKGSEAGTGLRGVLASLEKPSKAAAEALADLRVKTTDAQGKLLPLSDIFQQLKKSGAEASDIFAIFGREQASTAAALMNESGPAWAEMSKQINNSAGAASTMAGVLNSGLKGGFEQLKGSVDTVLIMLGSALLPIITDLVAIGTRLVNEWLLPAVQWFANLPEPVQAGAIAFAAMAAAIGPILVGIGTLLTLTATLGPALAELTGGAVLSTGAIFGWAIAIAAVVAALTALGVWTYQNWDAIAAGFIVQVIKVENAVRSLYQAIGYTEGVKAIDGELSRLQKTLDDHVWKMIDAKDKAEELKEQQAKLQEQIKKSKEEGDKAVKALQDLATGHGKAGKAAGGQKDETVKLAKAHKDFVPWGEKTRDAFHEMHQKAVPLNEQLFSLNKKISESTENFLKLNPPVVTMGDILKNSVTPAVTAAGEEIKGMTGKITLVKPEVVTLGESLNSLGLTSAAKFTQLAADAKTAYDAVVASGMASQWEKDSAFIKLLEAEEAAMRANGITVPAEHAKMLADIKAKTEDPSKGLPATVSKFEEFGNSVSTVITNFAQGISKSLWEGDTSWGEKGKELLKSLGETVTSAFIEPASKAIAGFISGAIKDLLSGDGLGGVLDSIKGIGKSFSGIFGGGSDAADVADKVPVDKVPGVPGAGAGGAAGGLMGTLGAIGAIGSMISGFIGNLQNISMSTDLGHIEENTRTTAIIIRDQMWGLFHETLPRIAEYIVYAVEHLHDAYGEIADFKYSFGDIKPWISTMRDSSGHAADTLDLLYSATLAQGTATGDRLDRLIGAVLDVQAAVERSTTFNLLGTDPSLVASRIGGQLRLQGGVA